MLKASRQREWDDSDEGETGTEVRRRQKGKVEEVRQRDRQQQVEQLKRVVKFNS